MSDDSVSRVDFVINGEQEDNIKNFKRHEVEDAAQINFMRKTGHIGKTARHQFSVDYVVPAGTKRNWRAVSKATVLVVMDDGSKLTFYGVRCLKRGEMTLDGEKETVQTISLGAERASDD
jgi:hypothetical protein